MEGGSLADEHEATDRPLISVVVPVRDGMPWVEQQLRALSSQELSDRWEVVVADNGSQDGTRLAVQRWSEDDPRIRLVDASARRGPGAARNIGARAARGRLLAFCDADDVVRPGWVAAMVAALADADLVTGLYDLDSLNGRSGGEPRPAVTAQLGFLPFGLGANLAIRREVFEAADGFCESLRAGEDVDLSWRLQLAGYGLAVTAGAVVAKRDQMAGWAAFRTGWVYGMCDTSLYRHYGAKGMRRDPRGTVKAWVWLVVASPGVLRRAQRREWVRALGIRLGRLAGSLAHRVFFP